VTAQTDNKILVLGLGNILLRDEGIGVRVVERMLEQYEFADNIKVLDGGVRGIILMDPIIDSDHVIVVDAVLNDHPPATIYRLDGEDVRLSLAFKNSVHDMDFLETLCCCELVSGKRPSAVIIGIEPKDFQSDPSLEISQELLDRIPEMIDKVLHEIEAVGGSYKPKAA